MPGVGVGAGKAPYRRPDVLPEIQRIRTVAEPVAIRSEGQLHFATDVFDALLDLRRWNEAADDPRQAEQWRS